MHRDSDIIVQAASVDKLYIGHIQFIRFIQFIFQFILLSFSLAWRQWETIVSDRARLAVPPVSSDDFEIF